MADETPKPFSREKPPTGKPASLSEATWKFYAAKTKADKLAVFDEWPELGLHFNRTDFERP